MEHTATPHLLVVDDDERLRALLSRYLGEQGWMVTCAKHADDARVKMTYFQYDLMVLDVMMPGENGVAFADALRSGGERTPILMLTAMGEADDRIKGFEAGVDDYLPKPFEPRELALRIQSILARTMRQQRAEQSVHFGVYQFDLSRKRLQRSEEMIALTETEADMLEILAQHIDQVVSREQLSDAIAQPGEEINLRSTDVLITRLRRKIEDEPSRPVYIQTVRGKGYVLQG